MKETGIMMSGDHPRKILDGIKTMTRRTYGLEMVNQFPDDWKFLHMEGDLAVFLLLKKHAGDVVPVFSRSREIRGKEPNLEFLFKCPYGQIGDRLRIRETWAAENRYNHFKPSEIPRTATIYYLASIDYDPLTMGKKRPSIYMPKWASRINLEVTGLRAERLQEITEGDAIAEGVSYSTTNQYAIMRPLSLGRANRDTWPTPQEAFEKLWDSLNAKRGYGWDFNPWVWPISFKEVKA